MHHPNIRVVHGREEVLVRRVLVESHAAEADHLNHIHHIEVDQEADREADREVDQHLIAVDREVDHRVTSNAIVALSHREEDLDLDLDHHSIQKQLKSMLVV